MYTYIHIYIYIYIYNAHICIYIYIHVMSISKTIICIITITTITRRASRREASGTGRRTCASGGPSGSTPRPPYLLEYTRLDYRLD